MLLSASAGPDEPAPVLSPEEDEARFVTRLAVYSKAGAHLLNGVLTGAALAQSLAEDAQRVLGRLA